MNMIIGKLGRKSTAGEKILYKHLKTFIAGKKDVFCYYEPLIGDDRPDFVLLTRELGVLIIEVKDYLESNLASISPSGPWTLRYSGSVVGSDEVSVGNPFDQLYECWRSVIERLSMEDRGEISRLVLLSKISRNSEWGRKIIGEAPSRIRVMFKEDVRDAMAFINFLQKHIPTNRNISRARLRLIRGNLVPTSRLPTFRQTKLVDDFIEDADQLLLMDKDQEDMAQNLGDGHRLIFGVAGSGKTIILIARARYLALANKDWRILVLCYNKNLSKAIMRKLNPQDYDADIIVVNYHKWAKDVIQAAGEQFRIEYNIKARNPDIDKNQFFNEEVPRLLHECIKDTGRPRYNAILIDEAQDFDARWFESVVAALNPDTNSLLITCDGLQGIYARKRFYWSDVGIKARGRTKKLRKTYRNPEEIGRIAKEILPPSIVNLIGTGDEFLATEEFARKGGDVDVSVFSCWNDEAAYVVERIEKALEKNWEILLIFRENMKNNNYNHLIFTELSNHGIRWADAGSVENGSKIVYVGTPQGTKGLEADAVFVPELNNYRDELARQLLYICLTRATRMVVLTANRMTEFIKMFEKYFQNEESKPAG
ncbi:MAG: ATP-binding domain-containing protein [Promethearchaeota archaeon]